MKTLIIAITLFSGAIAGTLLGLINQVVVEPFIDKAIAIQTQRAIDAGENIDPLQQLHYRVWQKAGEVVASTIYGISLSALYGIVFVYSRNSLPGSNDKKKALVLTGIMFGALFLIPTLKLSSQSTCRWKPRYNILQRELVCWIYSHFWI